MSLCHCAPLPGLPASRHDAYMYKHSGLRKRLESRTFFPPVGAYLLDRQDDDSTGVPILPYIVADSGKILRSDFWPHQVIS